MINVGVVTMARGSGETPKVYTESALLDYDTVLQPEGGMLSEGGVAMKRDLRERAVLLDVADHLPTPAIAMVDGPLELIRDPQAMGGFESFVEEYETILTGFLKRDLALLGYIDKSQNDLIWASVVAHPCGNSGTGRTAKGDQNEICRVCGTLI